MDEFLLGVEMPSQLGYAPSFAAAIRRMGVQFLTYYTRTTKKNAALDAPGLEVDAAMRRLARECGCSHALSCYTDSPDSAVIAANRDDGAFMGIIFDEIEHCRCLWPHSDEPLIPDGSGLQTLLEAYEAALRGYQALQAQLMPNAPERMIATHIWPVMLHVAARAGWTVCPKLCKELYSPISMAIALGAALQYDVPLWVDIDLWYYAFVPGHPPEELRDNLVFAYRMGVDRAYIEGAGLNLAPAGHQGGAFSLFHQISDRQFQLTPHGEVVRWFTQTYVPEHPRDYTFRDIQPDIAIIRMEDTCHGQRYVDATFPDHLYGLPQFPSTDETEEWLKIWDVLTCGATGSDGLTYFKAHAGYDGRHEPGDLVDFYRNESADPLFTGRHRFFAPLHGVVVYDHLVSYERLLECRLLFLAGTYVSPETVDAVRRAVREGAVCVMTQAMASKLSFVFDPGHAVTTHQVGAGCFHVVQELRSHRVLQLVHPFLGRSDQIVYRLRDGRRIVIHRDDASWGTR